MKTSISDDKTLTEPKILYEIDQIAFKVVLRNVQSSLASPVSYWYKQNTGGDVSSTHLTGSDTASGLDTIITKTTQNLKAGDWVLVVKATVDGQVKVVSRTPIIVKRVNQL